MTIHASWPGNLVAAAEPDRQSRTISGLAVPWDVPGTVSDGTTVVFHAGSLDPAARPIALRDHDRGRPIGRVTAASETETGMVATISVSRIPAGDETLILAGDGALPALSVGAEPTDWTHDQDGTLHVHAAEWMELSLLTFGAYPSALVDTVTAQKGPPMTMTDTPDTEEPVVPVDPDTPPDDDDDDKPDEVETAAAAVPITAGRAASRSSSAAHPYADVGIRQLAGLINAGDARTVGRIMTSPGAGLPIGIQAALTDVKLVGADNVNALHRPGYQRELIDIVTLGSPAVDMLRQGDLQRGDYPDVSYNVWTKTPQVALQSAEKAAINSTAVGVAPATAPVKTWATGNDLSQQVLDFGSPSFVEDYIRAAGVDYAEVIDTYAVTTLMAAATAVTTATGDNLVTIIGKLYGALDPTKVPAGQMVMLVSWDLGVGAMGIKGTADAPVFWDGSISFGSFIPSVNMGGLSITVDPNMPAKSALLMPRNAATWYDLPGTPFSLRAVNVGLLGLDIAVYGYGACAVQYPGALVKTTVP